jgi:alpha-aminoadipic semialdehyde synthase
LQFYRLDSSPLNLLIRYPGYSNLVQSFKDIGLLNTQPLNAPLSSWRALISRALGAGGEVVRENDTASLSSVLKHRLDGDRLSELQDALAWLGLLPGHGTHDLPAVPQGNHAPLDLLASLLAHKLRYLPGERDLVVLSHEIVAKSPNGPEETHTSNLVVYGDANASAMSRTVGLPVAFAALRVLDGHVHVRGVQGPTDRAIWQGVLTDLQGAGLGMIEKVSVGRSIESTLAAGFKQ